MAEMHRQTILHLDQNMPNELRRLGVDWESTPTTDAARTERTRGWSTRGVDVFRRQMLGHSYDYSAEGSSPAARLRGAQGTLLRMRAARYRELHRMLESTRSIDGVRIRDLARSTSPLAHVVRRAIATRDRVGARTDTVTAGVGTALFRAQPMDPRQEIMELEQAIESLLHVGAIPRPPLDVAFRVGPDATIRDRDIRGVTFAEARVGAVTVRYRGSDMTMDAYRARMRAERRPQPTLSFHWIFMERVEGASDNYLILNPRWDRDPRTGWVFVPDGSGNVIRPRDRMPCNPDTRQPIAGATAVTVPPQYIGRLLRREDGDVILSGTTGRGRVLARVERGAGGQTTRSPVRGDQSSDVLDLIANTTSSPVRTRAAGGGSTFATVFVRPRQ
jgi:hypothetical protein